jgi:hypothetical protein
MFPINNRRIKTWELPTRIKVKFWKHVMQVEPYDQQTTMPERLRCTRTSLW